MLESRRAASTGYSRRGTGAPLVLIHGVGMQAAFWQPQIEALSTRFDVIAIDMLGHGASRLPPVDATLGDYASQLLELLDVLGVERAHLVGHSMGALVAIEFALAHPERTRSVVAMNAVFCRTPQQRDAIDARLAALASGSLDDSRDRTLSRWFGDPVPPAARHAASVTRAMLESVDATGYARTYRVFAHGDAVHRERLGALRPPALFLTGEDDPNSSPAMSRTMAALAPLGRAEVVPGERHMMSVTSPERINASLLAFLTSVVQPRDSPS